MPKQTRKKARRKSFKRKTYKKWGGGGDEKVETYTNSYDPWNPGKKLNNSNTSKNSKKSNFSNMKYRTLGNDEWKHYNTNIRKSFHPNKFPQHLAKSDWEKNLTWNRNEYKRGFNKYTLKKN